MASIGDRLGDRGPFRTDGRRVAPVAAVQPRSVAGRVPVHDLLAEAAVIATVLLEGSAIRKVRAILPTAAPFYSPAHGRIFEAAIAVDDRAEPIDIVTVARELRARELLGQVGGAEALVRIVDVTPSVQNVEAHARIVAKLHRQRTVVARVQQEQAEGYDPVEDVEAWADALGRDTRALALDAGSALPWVGTDDIFAPLEPIPYVLEALDLCPGAPALVAGFGFGGKTLAMMSLAVAIAAGRRAWGEFLVRRGPVLWLDYEQGLHLTRLRFQRLARGMGVTREDLEGNLRVISMPRFYLDTPGAIDRLARDCDGARALFIDSFRAACPTVDENASESRVPLDNLGRMSGETGCAVAVIHHARKPSHESGGGGARMSMRGSGALYDAAGTVLILEAEKGEKPCVHHEKARTSGRLHEDFYLAVDDVETAATEVDELGRESVRVDPTGGLRVAFQTSMQVNPPAPPTARFDAIKADVLAAIRANPGCSLRYIRGTVKGSKDLISEAIEQLGTAGTITRTPAREAGLPSGYQAAQEVAR